MLRKMYMIIIILKRCYNIVSSANNDFVKFETDNICTQPGYISTHHIIIIRGCPRAVFVEHREMRIDLKGQIAEVMFVHGNYNNYLSV